MRIFNTYGSRLRPKDGRAIPTFIPQALRNEPLTVFGDGSQTRSFCYVDDLIEGIYRLLVPDYHEPVNLGKPQPGVNDTQNGLPTRHFCKKSTVFYFNDKICSCALKILS